ncbi:MAG: hypothetical protein MJZ31_10765 [Bacteroidales bacterium]|nr:hypothetical protein [Bacteroidales bacterium]
MADEAKIKDNEKYIAVASYITPAGWLVAFLFKWLCDVRTHFCIFHLKQGLGQTIVYGLFWVILSYQDWYIVEELVKLVYVLSQIVGIFNALNEKCRYVPLFGTLYDKILTFIK